MLVLKGLPVLLVNDIAGIVFYRLEGLPFWLAMVITLTKWSFFLLLTFYGIGWIVEKLRKWQITNYLLDKFYQLLNSLSGNNSKAREDTTRYKGIKWFIRKKERITLAAAFIPCVPFIPTIVTIAIRLLEVRYGLFLLFVGNIFKANVVCLAIYLLLPI